MTEFPLPKAVRLTAVGQRDGFGCYLVAEDNTTVTLVPHPHSSSRFTLAKLPNGRFEHSDGRQFEIKGLLK
jgi:hypothetical protein